jgi:hypothetical protein
MSNRSATNLDPTSTNASSHKRSVDTPGKVTTPVQVLNPQFAAYAAFEKAWKAGDLNPNEGMASGRYFGLDMAYSNLCEYNSNYYKVRSGRKVTNN